MFAANFGVHRIGVCLIPTGWNAIARSAVVDVFPTDTFTVVRKLMIPLSSHSTRHLNTQFIACSDYHEQCSEWAQLGECQKNLWMLENCRSSCNSCLSLSELQDVCQPKLIESISGKENNFLLSSLVKKRLLQPIYNRWLMTKLKYKLKNRAGKTETRSWTLINSMKALYCSRFVAHTRDKHAKKFI